MKAFLILSALLLAFALASCGDDDAPSTSSGHADEDADDDSAGDDTDDFSDEYTDGCVSGEDPGDYLFLSVNGISSFPQEFNQDDCPSSETCEHNPSPILGCPLFMVNGFPAPDLDHLAQFDAVKILIPFEDPNCNIACGCLFAAYTQYGAISNETASTGSNLPCSTEESNLYIGFSFFIVDEGEYFWSLMLMDLCGAASERVEGTFVF